MKRKIGVILLGLIFLNLISVNLNLVIGFEDDAPMPAIPFLGELDEESGLPESFEKFKNISEHLSEEESRKKYLKQEWTKILAESKAGGFFYYTDKFFSFFNFLWKYSFGLEFSWSWEFFLSVFIWIILVVVLYVPSKNLINMNPIFTLIFSIIITCLIGTTGVIAMFVNLWTSLIVNIWALGIFILIGIILTILYSQVIGGLTEEMRKESEEENLSRAKKKIISFGDSVGRFFKG